MDKAMQGLAVAVLSVGAFVIASASNAAEPRVVGHSSDTPAKLRRCFIDRWSDAGEAVVATEHYEGWRVMPNLAGRGYYVEIQPTASGSKVEVFGGPRFPGSVTPLLEVCGVKFNG